MLVRTMLESDLEAVLAVEEASFTSPWRRDDFRDSMENPGNCYLVAEEAGEIIGYCGFWGVPPEGQINNVAVKDTWRGMGIGFRMMGQLLARGEKMGLTAFTLEVRVSNLGAVKLYQKLGFAECGRRKGFYSKPMEDAIIMWRQ